MPRTRRLDRARRRSSRALSVLCATALLLITALAVAPSSQAEICRKLGLQAGCRLDLGRPGGNGGGSGDGPRRPLCHTGPPGYDAISCFSTNGPWNNERQCYLAENNDEIDYSRPEWEGHTTGRLYDCVNRVGLTIGTYWYADPPRAEGTPRDNAETVLNMRFVAFPIGLAPSARRYAEGSAGVVGMPVWMWAAGQYLYTYADPPVTVREPGTPYFVSAQTTHTTWDMGDGTTVRCKKGTEYFPSFKLRDSPTCGHRYKEPGYYRVTIRTYWTIQWRDSTKDAVQQQQLDFERSAIIRVLESQTVNAA
ncbi:hypothetical protein M3697_14365 [Janibacter melonis]|uniref:PKD domain-containing protein n=1 Tax=Janibacter melonis TaxID=262209 RepID=UPI0020442F06|nr:hypothetical protein [Janibacter melonis]MCM3556275.1 hypothetical protein [Janibacter melonis]